MRDVLPSVEQTRVSLAKVMLNSPQLLLLGKPTASLDAHAKMDEKRAFLRSGLEMA